MLEHRTKKAICDRALQREPDLIEPTFWKRSVEPAGGGSRGLDVYDVPRNTNR